MIRLYYLYFLLALGLGTVSYINSAKAQSSASVGRLVIGDPIPQDLWKQLYQATNAEESIHEMDLTAYQKKKLLIIEFWGYNCSGCVESIEKLNRLAAHFPEEDFGVLPVHIRPTNLDSAQKARVVKRMKDKNFDFPTVTGDTTLSKLFQTYIPHWGEVWIYEGRLLAVPMFGSTDSATIARVLAGQHVPFVNETNGDLIDPDPHKDFFLAATSGRGYWLQHAHGGIGRYMPVWGGIGRNGDTNSKIVYQSTSDSTLIRAINLPPKYMLFEAYKNELQPNIALEDAIVWEIDEHQRQQLTAEPLHPEGAQNVAAKQAWRTDHVIGYQLRYPGVLSEEDAMQFVRRDVTRFYAEHENIEFAVEKARTHRYAVLRNLISLEETQRLLQKSVKGKHTKGGITVMGKSKTAIYHYYQIPYKSQLQRWIHEALSYSNGRKMGLTISGIADSTGLAEDFLTNVTLAREVFDSADLSKIQQTLKPYGLYIEIIEKKVPVLVVRNRKTNNTKSEIASLEN